MSRMDFSLNWTGNLSMSRTGDINQSLNQSMFITETSKHKVKSMDGALPVQVIEAMATDSISLQTISVKISEFDWAWLVCGRKLFVWKYKADAKRPGETPCFELELPPSDLSHKAELVTLLQPSQPEKRDKNIVSLVAVSPEGTLRYWPNVAYESHSIENSVPDLHGEECSMLANIDLTTCVLGTTTNTLLCININTRDSVSPIQFRTFRTHQGFLASFTKQVTGLFLGAMPTAHSQETRSLVRISAVPPTEDQRLDSQAVVVLAGTILQKWLLLSNSEQLLYEHDTDKSLRNAFRERVWGNHAPLPNPLQIWCVDLSVRHSLPNQYTLLVACSNQEQEYPRQLHFAIAVFEDQPEPSNPAQLVSFNVLANHSLNIQGSFEDLVTHTHMLVRPQGDSLIYVYDQSKVLCVQGTGEVLDVIDFGQNQDSILGGGFDANGSTVLFTAREALVSLIATGLHHNQLSAHGLPVPVVHIEAPSEDDKLAKLESAFHHWRKKETANHALLFLQTAFTDSSGKALVTELNQAVVTLSANMLDATPSTDPRWAESEPRSLSGSMTASVIVAKQIEEKLSNHFHLIDFLKASPFWNALQTSTGNYPPTQLMLYEHLEKLSCAYSVKCKQSNLSYLLDPVIKQLAEKRGQTDNGKSFLLTPQDLFYRCITKVHDIFPAVVDFEQHELTDARTASTSESYNLVASFADLLIGAFQEVAILRRNFGAIYAAFSQALDDYSPWDASTEPAGVRQSLLRQIRLLAERGFVRQTTPDEDIEFKSSVYQKLAELTDSLLGSYTHQLSLLKPDSAVRVSVQPKFETDRSECLTLLTRAGQFERARVLAEKYLDFDILIGVCEELDERETLKNYCNIYAEYNFAEYMFNWFIRHGKQAKMLTTALPADASLDGFLRQHEQLQWLHQIHSERFDEASQTLFTLSSKEPLSDRKKTLQSLSKLAALAAGRTPPVDVQSQLMSH